jgi:hypothetical protein
VTAMFLAADNLADAGFLYLLLFLGALGIGLVWLFFPFIVNSRLKELIREIKGLRADLKKEENAQRPTPNVQRTTEEKAARDAKVPPTLPEKDRDIYRID